MWGSGTICGSYGLNRALPAGKRPPMRVIWDGAGGRRVFQRPLDVIRADSPAEVPAALKAVEAALGRGKHIAGWLGYELGYALEPRLVSRTLAGPLLRLGVFQAPESRAPEP